ncbi:MAG: L,D-transpeptidase family protein [Coriobacteriales bacterium]|nr:L,D-transpeptidase family protein [Coriobacteriales bacterium]
MDTKGINEDELDAFEGEHPVEKSDETAQHPEPLEEQEAAVVYGEQDVVTQESQMSQDDQVLQNDQDAQDMDPQESFVDDDNAWLEDFFDEGLLPTRPKQDEAEPAAADASQTNVEATDITADDAVNGDNQFSEPAEMATVELQQEDLTQQEQVPEDQEDTTPAITQRMSLFNIPSPEDEAQQAMPTQQYVRQEPRPTKAVKPIPLDTMDPSTSGGFSLQSDLPKVSSHTPMGGADVNRKRRWPLVLLAIVAALLLVYVIGALYFMSHFFPNTTVNGEDVSNMSVSELSSHVTNLGATYKTRIAGQGLDLTVDGKDIDFSYDGATYGAEAGAQISAWTWPIELTKTHAYSVNRGITFDEHKLDDLVIEAITEHNDKTEPPTDATAQYDEDSKKFVLVPEKIGTQLHTNSVQTKAREGVSGMSTDIAIDQSNLRQPKITTKSKELLDEVDRANKLLDKKIMIRIADKDAKEIDQSLLKKWLSINDECELDVDRDAIKEWASGPLSDEFDTVGNKRTYKRPDGAEIEIEGGTYGWILNGEELSNIIADNLSEGNTDPIDAPMSQTADSWDPNGKEWPNRYIDADLAEQHVRMYDDNGEIIWESDCVSGNTSQNHGTVLGAFFIQDKASPMKLIGLDYNNDGFPDYESDVTFWMPFDGGYGLHDATWRGSFGGNIYTYDGSHGCINLPYSAAQKLYEIANVGDVVIVHY